MEKSLKTSFTSFMENLFIKDKLDEDMRNLANYIVEDAKPKAISFRSGKSGNLLFVDKRTGEYKVFSQREVTVEGGYVTDRELGYIRVPLYSYLRMVKKSNGLDTIVATAQRFLQASFYMI